MSENVCPQCGAPISPGASECKFCGEKLVQVVVNQALEVGQPQSQSQSAYTQNSMNYQGSNPAINPAWPIKSKVVAGLLGIFLGAIGVHKFYMGKIGMGILYLLFSWTTIPGIIGFFEGIIYLCSNDENFQLKHHVRIQ